MKYLGYLILIILIIIGVTFAVLNPTQVKIDYYFAQAQLSLSLVLAFAFVIGVLLGAFIITLKMFRIHITNRTLRRKVLKLEQQLTVLESKREVGS